MSSYVESVAGREWYVAVLSAGKCRYWHGLVGEMRAAFCLPEGVSNINDVSGYVFSSWLGFRKIRVVLRNSGGLKKDVRRFKEIMGLLEEWKVFWEQSGIENEFVIEMG